MFEFSLIDHQMMALAIQLAKRGQYTTSPNPNVGCVISSPAGKIVGQGWHQKAGTPHAEVHALKQAGFLAKGATAYVTLEPCSHFGRTPPCAKALVEAGISRVVVAMQDPNPLVSGRGMQILQRAGVVVQHGLLKDAAVQLNLGFIKRMSTGLPRVTVKLAASLDGKTALHNGLSQWITGPEARQDVQRHRAHSCAILSGSGTVMADNPTLNVRYKELGLTPEVLAEENLRQPLRVIVDGRNQLPPNLRLLQQSSSQVAGDVLLVNGKHSDHLFAEHVSQWQAPFNGNKLDLDAVMKELGDRQTNDVWVEAGAKLAGALLQNNLIDELILYQAPKLIGGSGQNLFDILPIESMNEVHGLSWTDVRQVGKDLKMTAYFIRK
ncbi:MAG: bifunctional diaminohydroxyphosphoribosylaminopyrimidine deaminase/5-amino-6-(5-phosphoribosylamino)uracil reductase RibD [Paraglaciecola sp.]|uniref:bifunctional diaminohydroxyphosphoribosylaminopyrimidine deaminase/5-amino-6-(5-phosphoribosylamino)uracil reductase RibD n=1 Tax=Paraglaciecola sp. TaxID=1920173 RepID=UPI00329936F2